MYGLDIEVEITKVHISLLLFPSSFLYTLPPHSGENIWFGHLIPSPTKVVSVISHKSWSEYVICWLFCVRASCPALPCLRLRYPPFEGESGRVKKEQERGTKGLLPVPFHPWYCNKSWHFYWIHDLRIKYTLWELWSFLEPRHAMGFQL